jgi:hypothetical protein
MNVGSQQVQDHPAQTDTTEEQALRRRPALLNIPSRLLLGFSAGALSHVVFQGALGTAYFASGLIPGLPWGFEPLPPFGVPRTVNFAFWAGLWGIAYALLEPRLTARVGLIQGGLLFGVAAMLVRWFVVLPLKGAPVVEGFVPNLVIVYSGFHLIFGIGLALIFGAALRLAPSLTWAPSKARHG